MERGSTEVVMTKNEIVLALASRKEEALRDSKEMDLYISCTQFRLMVTLNFLLDVEHELSLVSLAFQKHSLAPSDVISTIEKLYLVVETLYTSNGAALQHFLDEFDPVTSAYRGINLEDADGGMVLFQKDRKEILDSLLA